MLTLKERSVVWDKIRQKDSLQCESKREEIGRLIGISHAIKNAGRCYKTSRRSSKNNGKGIGQWLKRSKVEEQVWLERVF